jgi:LacI family transcriptional regulator
MVRKTIKKSSRSVGKKKKSDKANRVSIYDLAEATGFSPGTVSRVINNRDRVKPDTREKVLIAAREMGFKPQATIRRPEIGLITESDFNDRINGYQSTLIQNLAFSLTKKGMNLLLPEEKVTKLPISFMDGIIVISEKEGVRKYLDQVADRIPTVYFDQFDLSENKHIIYSDHQQSGYLAAQHFIHSGRKKISFFSSKAASNDERLKGFRTAMKENKIEIDENLIYLRHNNEPIYTGLNSLVRMETDAIYVPGSSYEAIEAMHILCYVMNIKVPDQVAIIGGENEKISSMLNPPMTTIEEPLQEMASKAVEIMEALIKNENIDDKCIKLPVRLIKRASGS